MNYLGFEPIYHANGPTTSLLWLKLYCTMIVLQNPINISIILFTPRVHLSEQFYVHSHISQIKQLATNDQLSSPDDDTHVWQPWLVTYHGCQVCVGVTVIIDCHMAFKVNMYFQNLHFFSDIDYFID